MQNKDKKTILNLIIICALAFAIVGFFVPVSSVSYSDVLVENGYEQPDLYWVKSGSLLSDYFSVYDYRDSNKPSEFHRYTFFNFLKFENGEPSGEFSSITDYDSNVENNWEGPLSYSLIRNIEFIFSLLLFLLFIFFCYKIFKNNAFKQNNLILYLGLVVLVTFFYALFSYYYGTILRDVNNLGYANVLKFEYGFYLTILSIILLLSLYILKKYNIFFNLDHNNVKK